MDTIVKESAPVIEAAPEAPAAPAFNAEQAIAALSARMDELVGKFAAKFEAVVEEAPAVAEAPVAEEAPAVVEAPAPEASANLESNDKIVALETKLARKATRTGKPGAKAKRWQRALARVKVEGAPAAT